ncbi:MAG TPA: hypothetical protein ENI60_04325 [Candidatus Fraserbacteria bacterium]|nr:hypothetical protein [Candidatus Fraserbacteria bacterium]
MPCLFREQALDEAGRAVYHCRAGGDFVLGTVGSLAVQQICGSCLVPAEYAPERQPCLYLVPLRVFGSAGTPTFLLCRWFYHSGPRSWVHSAEQQCPCPHWFPHPGRQHSPAIEAMNAGVIRDALALYREREALLSALGTPEGGCPICQRVSCKSSSFLNGLSAAERTHLCQAHRAQQGSALRLPSQEEQLQLLEEAERALEQLAQQLAQPGQLPNHRINIPFWLKRHLRRRRTRAELGEAICPACTREAEWIAPAMKELIGLLLRDPAGPRLYTHSAGLCANHFGQLLAQVGQPWHEHLLSLQRQALAQQRARLEQLQRG